MKNHRMRYTLFAFFCAVYMLIAAGCPDWDMPKQTNVVETNIGNAEKSQ